jgi:pimeloyl-ACP methyl ester carboxylesterase
MGEQDGRVTQGRRRIRNEAAVYPQDVFTLKDHPGLERIAPVGYDRGARVATGSPTTTAPGLTRLVVMDNVPTRILAENPSNPGVRAGGWFSLFFTGQPSDPKTPPPVMPAPRAI